MLVPALIVVAFVLLCVAAARDPKNRLDNPDGYDDADDWRGP